MCKLQIKPQYLSKIIDGRIKHLIVCKEEGIKRGDVIALQSNYHNCMVKVEDIADDGCQMDEDVCILKIVKI